MGFVPRHFTTPNGDASWTADLHYHPVQAQYEGSGSCPLLYLLIAFYLIPDYREISRARESVIHHYAIISRVQGTLPVIVGNEHISGSCRCLEDRFVPGNSCI